MAGYGSKKKIAPTEDEAMELARKRWDQLSRLEPSMHKRRQKLKDFLRRKGVSFDATSAIVDQLLESLEEEAMEEDIEEEEEVDEEEAYEEALGLAQNRWRKLLRLEPNTRKRRDKLKQFLMRRGIGFDTVSRILDDERLAS